VSERFPELCRLIDVIARLRAPGGCPWDREQTERSMAPHLLEECYEAIDAIAAGDREHEREELGDVLMNVAMIAQIGKEAGRYDLEGVAAGIADKLIRRHPHVFGEVKAETSGQVLENWERIKRDEKPEKKAVLSGVPKDLPALLKAFRIGEKAARVGFDWPDRRGPREKVTEEVKELDEALAKGDAAAAEAELGDLLFAIVNLARHAKIDPEVALRTTIDKFVRRFAHVERTLGERLGKASLEEMDRAWDEAKARENA
jgi:MazG family protein